MRVYIYTYYTLFLYKINVIIKFYCYIVYKNLLCTEYKTVRGVTIGVTII